MSMPSPTKLARRTVMTGLGLAAATILVAGCSTTEPEREDLVARAKAARADLFRQVPAA
jgi:hypothetical protein